ncbi:13293_t:CDS:2, partial [Ambispora gerdemannii]
YMSRNVIHKYFERRTSEYDILGFLNECDLEPFERKGGKSFLLKMQGTSGEILVIQGASGRSGTGPVEAQSDLLDCSVVQGFWPSGCDLLVFVVIKNLKINLLAFVTEYVRVLDPIAKMGERKIKRQFGVKTQSVNDIEETVSDNEIEDEREIDDFTNFDLVYHNLDPAKMWTLES